MKKQILIATLFIFLFMVVGIRASPTITNVIYPNIGDVKATITSGIAYNENGYYDFNGISGTMNTANTIGNFNYSGSNLTISVFANMTNTAGTKDIVSKYSGTPRGWIFRAVGSTLRLSIINNSDNFHTVDITSGAKTKLTHYAFSVDSSGNVAIYIDGVLSASSLINNQFDDGITAIFQIGSRGSEFWNGSIDEVRVYNKTLTNSDIISLNNSGIIKNTSLLNDSLVLYYSFSDAGALEISGSGGLNLSYLNESSFDKTKFNQTSENTFFSKAVLNFTSSNVNLSINNEILRLFSGDYFSGLFSSDLGLVNITNSTIVSWNGTDVDTQYGDFDYETNDRPRFYILKSSSGKRLPTYFISSNFSYIDSMEFSNSDDSLIQGNIFSYNTIGLTLRTSHRSTFKENTMHDIHTNKSAIDGQNLTKGVQYLSSKNGTIENNTFYNIYALHVPEISAAIHCYNACDNTVVRNNRINNSEVGILFYINNKNITWEYNTLFNISREGLRIEATTGEVYNFTIRNNILNTIDTDETNTSAGIHIFGANKIEDVYVYNNSINNYTLGFSYSFGNRIYTSNNTFENQRHKGARTISIGVSNSTYESNLIRNFFDGIRIHNSENVTISNQIFINGANYEFQFFQDISSNLRETTISNVSSDNSVSNHYEFSANVSNLNINTNSLNYTIKFIGGSEGDVEYSNYTYPFYDGPSLFNNTVSDQTLNFTNIGILSNALIYFSNNSVACSDINSCDGNINITLSPNNYSYVLDNFNLTEGVSRQNSPLWFAQATLTEIHIASNISAINTTVKINNPGWGENCRFVTELSYTPNGSATQLWQDDIQAQSICTQLTTTGYVLQVNPSVNSNVLRITYTTQPQGAGGGGSIGGDPLGNTDLNLCNLTYKYIKNYSQTDYSQIDASKGNYSWTEVRRYLDNWQPYCSNAIKRTLKEEYVCDKLFYFIVENQGSYSLSDINSLRNELTPEIQISNNLLMYYTDNYETMCKYGKTLPFKRDKIGNLTVIKNLTDCNLNTNLSLFGLDYDKINIPLGKIYISETSCKTLNFYKWFIKIEKEGENLIINGIKFGWLITLFLIVSIILIIKTQSKTSSMMRGMFRKS